MRRVWIWAGCLLMVVLLVLVNALLSRGLSGWRWDLTEEGLYSLSPGVDAVVGGFDEPVLLELYVSGGGVLDGLPAVRGYADRVREFLEELVGRSGGKLRLVARDPEPFSEAEDAARSAGLVSLPIDGSGRTLTLGLVMTNASDRRESLAFLDPMQEATLEYEVVRALASLRSGERAKVGLLTALPMAGNAGGGGGMMMEQPSLPWVSYRQMQAFYDVVPVDRAGDTLPADLSALVVVHPENLSDGLQRAIDRYVVGGGRLLLCFDGFCESAQGGGNPMLGVPGGMAGPSSMGPMPAAWGVGMVMGKFAADVTLAPRLPTGRSASSPTLPYLAIMDVPAERLDREALLTRSISRLIFASPGVLELTPKEGLVSTVLARTSDGGGMLDTGLVSVMPDAASMLRAFKPGTAELPLVVRLQGTFTSAFDDAPADVPAVESRPGEVILVADADFLQDPYWLQNAGPMGLQPIADNGNLVLNALELLTGDPVLASLKPRGRYQRPFEVVERLRRDAESRFLARQEQLEEQVNDTQRKLAELQAIKPDEQLAVLSPEQEAEVARLQEQVTMARTELRAVRYELNRDIDTLGQRLMVMNVVLWPMLVFCAAILWWVARASGGKRRRRG